MASATDGKMKEVVVALAELLDVANTRVVKALDNEGKLKEAMKRLEGKVAQVVAMKKPSSSSSSSSSSSRHSTSRSSSLGVSFEADHLQCLKELVGTLTPYTVSNFLYLSNYSSISHEFNLSSIVVKVDARKQLKALAKDNSAGRLTNATAQEQSLEDDLKDVAAERQAIASRISLAKSSSHEDSNQGSSSDAQVLRLEASHEAVATNEKGVLAELQRLKLRNHKLVAAINERKEVNQA
jgi:hypothetical protein